MQRYFLHLAYKGTNFFGWQIQPNHPTIQEEIEKSLSQLHSGSKINIVGCGRTDTGVHASSYYAHFDTELKIDREQFKYKLNNMLHKDIGIQNIIPVEKEAHARFNAKKRTYHYFIHSQKDPFINDVSFYFPHQLDLDKMNKACLLLINHNNFQCFSKVKTDATNFTCDVSHALWIKTDKGYVFTISSNRFLRNMVRSIVGTMLDLGQSKISLEDFDNILKSQSRAEAGKSVPPHGLFLAEILYPENLFK